MSEIVGVINIEDEILYLTSSKKNGWNDRLRWTPKTFGQTGSALSTVFEVNNDHFFSMFDFRTPEGNKPDYSIVDKRFAPILDAFFIWHLLKKRGEPAWLTESYIRKYYPEYYLRASSTNPLDYEGITFIGKFNNWFAAKKLSIDEHTEMPEVLQTLASINTTVITKSFLFVLGNDTVETCKKRAVEMVKGKRKGYKNLYSILEKIDSEDDMLKPCILHETLSLIKMLPYINAETFNKIFPEYKIKLPPKRGRKRRS